MNDNDTAIGVSNPGNFPFENLRVGKEANGDQRVIGTCENCAFHFPDGEGLGNCHRNAPQPTDNHGGSYWPCVGGGDWCGEWLDAAKVTRKV